MNMQVGVQKVNELQRAKIGVPAQNEQDKTMLLAIDNKRAKDKVKQKARQQKNKTEQIELRKQKRLLRQQQQYDDANNLIQYGQEKSSNANSSAKAPKKTRKKQLTIGEKRGLYEADGGDQEWWKCDLCDTILKKDEDKNRDHRWNKQCSSGIKNRYKKGYITEVQYEKMLQEKQILQEQRKQEKKSKEESKSKKKSNKKRKTQDKSAEKDEEGTKKKKKVSVDQS